jgi:glycosyltransferase involved in cell wall biosynthesis
MASGVPVIASQSGALPELIGDAGLLVPPGDVGAWAAVLRRLAVEPAERRHLAACARARALDFSWPEVARRHVELYREMLHAER